MYRSILLMRVLLKDYTFITKLPLTLALLARFSLFVVIAFSLNGCYIYFSSSQQIHFERSSTQIKDFSPFRNISVIQNQKGDLPHFAFTSISSDGRILLSGIEWKCAEGSSPTRNCWVDLRNFRINNAYTEIALPFAFSDFYLGASDIDDRIIIAEIDSNNYMAIRDDGKYFTLFPGGFGFDFGRIGHISSESELGRKVNRRAALDQVVQFKKIDYDSLMRFIERFIRFHDRPIRRSLEVIKYDELRVAIDRLMDR